MRMYATAQATGTRSHQCDATAVRTAPRGARAYVLLDGIGSSDAVRDWTRAAARRLAGAAAHRGNAEAGLRAVYDAYRAERLDADRYTGIEKAAAVVVVAVPGEALQFAWCGDSRAYIVSGGAAHKVTDDHNLRRVYPARDGRPGGNRNSITSCLGSSYSSEEIENYYGHPAIESALLFPQAGPVRLVLASDGAYEPHEDEGRSIATELAGTPRDAARRLVTQAVTRSLASSHALDPARVHADNATALVADLQR